MNIETVIAGYVKLRTQRDELKKKQAAEMLPINDAMFKLSAWLQKQLQETGQTSAKTGSGTAFLQTDTTVAIDDWESTIAFIKEHDLYSMLERRVSKSVVTDYIESTQTVPPGLTIKSEISCHVRKA
jgi:hypothetical protein